MSLIKKKNLQEGEFVVYAPQVFCIKAIGPVTTSFLILFFLLLEVFFTSMSAAPMFVSAMIITILTIYFILQIMENIIVGRIANKFLIALIVMALLLFGLHLSDANSVFFNLFLNIIINTTNLLFTLFVLSCAHATFQLVEYFNEEYYLTNKRLIIKKGIFLANITDIPIEKLESLNFIQGFWGSLFSYGTISILGLGGSRTCLISVRKPHVVRRKINMIIEKNKAVTVIFEDYPESTKRTRVIEEEVPNDLFSYGTLVKQLRPTR